MTRLSNNDTAFMNALAEEFTREPDRKDSCLVSTSSHVPAGAHARRPLLANPVPRNHVDEAALDDTHRYPTISIDLLRRQAD
jgi:hypothetical protein